MIFDGSCANIFRPGSFLDFDGWKTPSAWANALTLFGEQGGVDLMGLKGYYTCLAMVMRTARTGAPVSSAAPLPE